MDTKFSFLLFFFSSIIIVDFTASRHIVPIYIKLLLICSYDTKYQNMGFHSSQFFNVNMFITRYCTYSVSIQWSHSEKLIMISKWKFFCHLQMTILSLMIGPSFVINFFKETMGEYFFDLILILFFFPLGVIFQILAISLISLFTNTICNLGYSV